MAFKLFSIALITLSCSLYINFSNAQSSLQSDQRQGFLSKPFENKYSKGPFKPLENLGNATVQNDISLAWRLKGEIIPSHYKLKLTPILEAGYEAVGEQWKVPAEVIISVEVKIETSKITLHSKYLEYDKNAIKILDDASNPIAVIEMTTQDEHNFVEITVERPLLVGEKLTIQITYVAQIQEELHGLYRSSYVVPSTGETKTIAVSQMEALNARELFPCFDEPSYKAVFEVTIGRLEKHTALTNSKSNGNPIPMEGHPGWVLESFESTAVPMSTYIFALVVSEFTYAEAPGDILPETIVRTYAPEHYINRQGGEYASLQSEIILQHFGEYFGERYPLSKMDMAAAPSFYFGAMENFGLNIYRESLLLYFPDESTESERFSMTSVFSHELAHQWFGNIVSPAWWTHIWLNEGMATFVGNIGIEKTVPEFKPWDFFITDVLQYALYYDAMKDYSHPLKIIEEQWIERDAMSWFDSLTYQKGGSLARMIQGVLTEPVMQQGLKDYEAKMKSSAAVQDDLFESLNNAATSENKLPVDLTIQQIMDTWTLQAGFPLVTVSRSEEGTLQVNQKKFGEDASEDLWYIPLSIATSDDLNFDPTPEYWLRDRDMILSETTSTSWVIANAGTTGFYRVWYDSTLQQQLLDQLESDHSKINHFSRSQILDDYFALADSGVVTIETAMLFTKYLRSGSTPEVEMIVWIPVLSKMQKALNLFGTPEMREDLQQYLLPGITGAISETGGYNALNVDSKGINVLRHTTFLDWACALSDTGCQDFALELVSQWMEDPTNNPIQRDLKPIVYCGAVAKGGIDTFDFIYEQYLDTTITSKQQSLLLNALACVGEDELINELLGGTIHPGYFLEKDHGLVVLRNLAGNLKARKALIEFLSSNVAQIINFYGGPNSIIEVVNTLSGFLSSNEELALIEALATNENINEGSLENSLNAIRRNIQWVETTGTQILDFIRSVLEPTTTPPATTTDAGTSASPTTDAGTSASPTTDAGTSASPTTDAGTSASPTTDAGTSASTTTKPTEPTSSTDTEEPPVETTTPEIVSSTSKGFMTNMDWKLIPLLQTLMTILYLSLP